MADTYRVYDPAGEPDGVPYRHVSRKEYEAACAEATAQAMATKANGQDRR